jgi:hypothetical protein
VGQPGQSNIGDLDDIFSQPSEQYPWADSNEKLSTKFNTASAGKDTIKEMNHQFHQGDPLPTSVNQN